MTKLFGQALVDSWVNYSELRWFLGQSPISGHRIVSDLSI